MSIDLQNYLYHVQKLETTIFSQNQIAANLEHQNSQLGIKSNFDNFSTYVEPSDEYKQKYKSIFFWVSFCVFGIAYALIWIEVSISEGLLESTLMAEKVIFWILLLAGIPVFGLLFALIPCVIGVIVGHIKDIKIAKKHSLDRCAELLALSDKDDKRVEKEIIMKARINSQLQELRSEQQQTRQALDSLYAVNIIHPKYRNLIAVTTFYEYFETGICSQLEGHEGAYNTYETEMRMNRIIAQMDVVISKLDEIKDNQYTLYQAISQTNQTLQKIDNANRQMLSSLDSIERNSELIEYNTSCATERANAIADIMVIRELLK